MSKNLKLLNHLMQGVASVAVVGAVASLVPAVEAHAQDYTTGAIEGRVQDVARKAIGGATIRIESNRGTNRSVTSDASGNFRVPRLPIGEYTVTITSSDHETLSKQTLTVVAGSTISPVFTMKPLNLGDIEEVVVVGTSVGNWSFNSTTTGISIDVDELTSMAPVGRDVTSLALLSAGATQADNRFGNLPTFNGSSAGENIYYVNGFNISDVSNMTNPIDVPFDFYQTVETKTGGYQAEYGRSTGGVVNAVTKSGSNEFHFGANVYYEPNFARGKSPNIGDSNNSHNTRNETEFNFWVSGPLVKDKLFFYGMYSPRSYESVRYGQSEQYIDTTSDPFYAIKIDFEPIDGHRFEYTHFNTSSQYDRVTNDFANGGAVDNDDIDNAEDYVGSEKGTSFFRDGGEVHVARYTGVLTDWFTISGLYGSVSTDSTSQSTQDANPVIYNYVAGSFIPRGNWVNFSISEKTEKREAYRIDGDLFFDLAGSHHLRFGMDREDLTLNEFAINSGGAYYLYWSGDYPGTSRDNDLDPSLDKVRVRTYSNGGIFKGSLSAFYIQDSWEVTDQLMITAGLRNETFKYDNAIGETFMDMSNQLAFRVGFNYDLGTANSSRVYGSFGRYHLPMAINTAFRQAGGEVYRQDYYIMSGIGAGGVPQYDPSTLFGTDNYADGDVPETLSFVDQNVKSMYSDEIILGYETSIGDGWTIGARFLHRWLGRTMEDVAIDAAVIKWAEDNGYGDVSDIWSGYHQYVITNPGNDMVVSTPDLPGEDGAMVEMHLAAADLGYPKASRKYTAIDIEFAREWDGKWMMQGSYTWSSSKGNYEGNIKSDNGQDDAGITTDFDQPGLVDGAYGYLPNHRRHNFKVWGAYQVTDYLRVGGVFQMSSPRVYGCLGVHPTDEFAAAYGNASWYCDGQLTPRGSQGDTGWYKNLDLSATIVPAFTEDLPGDMSFTFELFNVFNTANVMRTTEVGSSPYYGQPAAYSAPRQARFSVKYKF